MNHEVLKRVIFDQQNVIRNAVITGRDYSFEKKARYILVGIRRAGKSTLLYSIVQQLIREGADWNQIIYVNFEDERLAEFRLSDFNDIVETAGELSTKKAYYFLDEVQNIDGWERFARRMADAGEFVWITGSNAKMLSSDMEARLGGRYLSKEIMPYNFEEYLDARSISHDTEAMYTTKMAGRIRKAAADMLHEGAFPESVGFQDKRVYVENIYQKILLGDIAARNGIRNISGLRTLMKKIAETICSEVSYTRLYHAVSGVGIKLSKDTIISYIGYARDAYLLFALENYYAKFEERESTPKFYFTDNGLLNLFLINKDSALLENLVAATLRRRYGDRFFYLKSERTGIDIDFYIPEKRMVIQAAWSIQDLDARRREVQNLQKLATASQDIRRFCLVTYEEEEKIEEDGVMIEVIPLYRFLLSND